MGKRLYVGGLPYSVTDNQLSDVFTPFGAVVSANVVTDKISGRSRGFGFVEMENDGDAVKAIESLNGTQLEGRALTVNEARPKAPRSPRGDFGGGGGGFGGRGGRSGGGGGGGRDRGGRGRSPY